MAIKVRFFASLAESVGRSEADIEFKEGLTVAQVWELSADGRKWAPETLCAVNHTYSQSSQKLSDCDEVAYFPPVTGG